MKQQLIPLALLGLAACGGGQHPMTSAEPETMGQCSGTPYVSVINDWDRAVEVYAYTKEGGAGNQIGTAIPGRTAEFALPRDAVRVEAATGGLTEPIPIPSRARRLVRLRYFCR